MIMSVERQRRGGSLRAGWNDRKQYFGIRASLGPTRACATVSSDSAHADDVYTSAPALLGRRMHGRQQINTWPVVVIIV